MGNALRDARETRAARPPSQALRPAARGVLTLMVIGAEGQLQRVRPRAFVLPDSTGANGAGPFHQRRLEPPPCTGNARRRFARVDLSGLDKQITPKNSPIPNRSSKQRVTVYGSSRDVRGYKNQLTEKVRIPLVNLG
jgi:hypothetical protein